MARIATNRIFKRSALPALVMVAAALAVLSGRAMSAQDKYTVKVPDGLAFAEFRGFESWQAVSVSQSSAKMAKIHWLATKSADAPSPTTIPGTLHDIDFMEKDGARFPEGAAWGYAQFNYNAASDSFTPLGTGAKCGAACHTIAAAKDHVFTAYGMR